MQQKTLIIASLLLLSLFIFPIVSANTPVELIQQARNSQPEWSTGVSVTTGEVYNYNNQLYEVVQSHTTQTGWQPPNVPALFTLTSLQELGEITEYRQPTGAQDAYNTGEKVLYNTKIYESLIDANVWNPVEQVQYWNQTGDINDLQQDIVIDGNVYYNSLGAVKTINGTQDLSNVEFTTRSVSAEQTSTNNTYEVTLYTGNDNIPYTFVNDETGDKVSTVSQDGYAVFTVNHFSTWTASIADITLGYEDSDFTSLEELVAVPSDVFRVDLFMDSSAGSANDVSLSVVGNTGVNECDLETRGDIYVRLCLLFDGANTDFDLEITTFDGDGVSSEIEQTFTSTLTLNPSAQNDDLNFNVDIVDDTTPPTSSGVNNAAWSYYTFDNTLVDAVGNDDAISTTASYTASGFVNGAYDYDGSSDNTILPDDMLDNNNTGTVAAWVYMDSLASANAVFAAGSTASVNPTLQIYFDTGGDIWVVERGDGGGSVDCVSTVNTFSTGEWLHVGVTSDGSTWKIYVNGTEESTTVDCGTNNGTWFGDLGSTYTHSYTWGAYRSTSTSKYFDGRIDEGYISDEALSATEIDELYNVGAGFNPYASTWGQSLTIPDQTYNGLTTDTSTDFIELTYTDYFSDVQTGDDVIIDFVHPDGTAQQETVTLTGTGTAQITSFNSGDPTKTTVIVYEDMVQIISPQKQSMYNNWDSVDGTRTHGLRLARTGESIIGNNFEISVDYDSQQVASLTNQEIYYGDSQTLILSDNFNYDSRYTVEFEHNLASQTLTVNPQATENSIYDSFEEWELVLTNTGSDHRLTLTSTGTTDLSLPVTVRVQGVDDQGQELVQEVSDTFTWSIREEPISQVASVSIDQQYNEITSYDLNNYYSNFDDFSISLTYNTTSYTLDSGNTVVDTGDFIITKTSASTFSVESIATDVSETIDITLTQTSSGDTLTDTANFAISELVVVEQIASIADINMDYSSIENRNFEDYFTGYDYTRINFDHNSASHTIETGGTLFYTSSDFDIVLDDNTGNVQYTSYTNDVTDLPITYTVSRSGGTEISDSFTFSISESNPVIQVASPAIMTMNYSSSLLYNPNDFFNNQDFYYTGLRHNSQDYILPYINDTLFLLNNGNVLVTNGDVEPDANNWWIDLQVASISPLYSAYKSLFAETTLTIDGTTFSTDDIILQMKIESLQAGENSVIHSNDYEYNGTVILGAYKGTYENMISSNETTTQLIITNDEETLTNPPTNGQTPTTGDGVISGLLGVFPSADSITFAQGMGIVVLFLIMIGGAGVFIHSKSTSSGEQTLIRILTGLVGLSAFILFVAIGYIPVWIPVIMVIGIVAYFLANTGRLVTGG